LAGVSVGTAGEPIPLERRRKSKSISKPKLRGIRACLTSGQTPPACVSSQDSGAARHSSRAEPPTTQPHPGAPRPPRRWVWRDRAPTRSQPRRGHPCPSPARPSAPASLPPLPPPDLLPLVAAVVRLRTGRGGQRLVGVAGHSLPPSRKSEPETGSESNQSRRDRGRLLTNGSWR